MTHNWLLDFHCVYTFIKVVSTEFLHVVCIEYSVFKSLSKLSQEQAAAAVNVAITSDKNRQRKKRKKRPVRNCGFKKGKTLDFMKLSLQNWG